jgi:RimJ/RimL family protein N-acetyltransferase
VLTGEKVALRARRREDLEPFAQFLDDVASHLRAGRGPWLPRSLQQRQAAYDHRAAGEPDPATASFVPEARLRQAVWTGDGFTDEVLLGLLAEEWRRGQANAASSAAKSASGTGAS